MEDKEQPRPIKVYTVTYSKTTSVPTIDEDNRIPFFQEESLEKVRNLGLEAGYETFTITDGANTIQGETNGIHYNKDKEIEEWFEDIRKAKEQERRPAKGEHRPFSPSTKFVALG